MFCVYEGEYEIEEGCDEQVEAWAAQSYHTPFNKKLLCWDAESQDVDCFSDNIIMPKYSAKQEPYIETPHYETYKQDSLKGMIKNWQNLNFRLQSEKSAKVPNLKKIKRFEEKLAILKDNLLRDSDFIFKNLHVSLTELFKTYVK